MLVKFGARCDGHGCTVVFTDYSMGDIVTCTECLDDLCASCREKTGHVVVGERADGRPVVECAA